MARSTICQEARLLVCSVNDEKNKEEKPHVNGNGIHFKVISNDGAGIKDTDLKEGKYINTVRSQYGFLAVCLVTLLGF